MTLLPCRLRLLAACVIPLLLVPAALARAPRASTAALRSFERVRVLEDTDIVAARSDAPNAIWFSTEVGRTQGRSGAQAGDAGNRDVGEGQLGVVHDQRHGRRDLIEERSPLAAALGRLAPARAGAAN